MDKVSTNHSLFEEKEEPKRYRTEVLPLFRSREPIYIAAIVKHSGLIVPNMLLASEDIKQKQNEHSGPISRPGAWRLTLDASI